MRALGAAALALLAFPALAQTQYESPIWSPDGRGILYVAKPAGGGAWDPAWAPDNSAIAFVSTIEGKRQISLMSPDGSHVRQLTHGPGEHFHPAWSHDSSRLACVSAADGASRVLVMQADGATAAPVTPPDQHARWPVWSPDGRRIAYYVESGAAGSLWAIDLTEPSPAPVKLFDSSLTRTLLDFSPDGKRLAFVRGAGANLGIDVLELDSGRVRRVVSNDLGPGEPRWSPDGLELLFSTHSPPGIAMLNLTDSSIRPMIN